MKLVVFRIWRRLSRFVRREPALLLGGAASALMVAGDAVLDAGATDWETAVPVIVSVVIRQVVTPAMMPGD